MISKRKCSPMWTASDIPPENEEWHGVCFHVLIYSFYFHHPNDNCKKKKRNWQRKLQFIYNSHGFVSFEFLRWISLKFLSTSVFFLVTWRLAFHTTYCTSGHGISKATKHRRPCRTQVHYPVCPQQDPKRELPWCNDRKQLNLRIERK